MTTVGEEDDRSSSATSYDIAEEPISGLGTTSSMSIRKLTNDIPKTPKTAPPGNGERASLGLALSIPPPPSDLGIAITASESLDEPPAQTEAYQHGILISPSTLNSLHGLDLHSPRANTRPELPDVSENSPNISRSRTLPRIKSWGSQRKTGDSIWTADGDAAKTLYNGEPAPLDADRRLALGRWILAVAIVNFDLDLGPVVERFYPELLMTSGLRENIAFSSFPDGALFDTGVQTHSFRIRDTTTKEAPGDGFIYGYSLFLQKRDASSKRGYMQRSVTILSRLPYPSLFTATVSKLGAFYFSHGVTMLETACSNIANWPDPNPGSALELGFLGTVMQAEIPRSMNEHQSIATPSFGEKFNPKVHILASLPTPLPSPVSLFASFLPKVWALWECLVLSEPLLIFAPSPSQTSTIIWWLRDFLRPIPLAGDFHPYFHIHDQDYINLVNKNPPKAGLILGVTNPFFGNLCKHWPHVLSVGRAGDAAKTQTLPQSTPFLGPPPGFHSKHKRFISKDSQLLKKLEDAVLKGGAAEIEACQLLRQHFTDRTTKLLAPLNRHFASLIPTDPKAPLKPFTPTSFLASLKTHGSLLPFRSASKQKEFYEKWLRTPAFGVWLTERFEEVQVVLTARANSISET